MLILDRLKVPPALALYALTRLWRRGREFLLQSLFASRGDNLRFDPDGYYTFRHIHVGTDVVLGRGAVLMASESEIFIGNKVMFGPGVMVVGGNHNTAVIGRAMFDVQEKRAIDDQDVIIEDDVWVGARSVILKGVVLRRGAIVGAGSVVTKEVPPYAIVAGNPARLIRFRWTVDEILAHETSLYPPDQRLRRDSLQQIQEQPFASYPSNGSTSGTPDYQLPSHRH